MKIPLDRWQTCSKILKNGGKNQQDIIIGYDGQLVLVVLHHVTKTVQAMECTHYSW